MRDDGATISVITLTRGRPDLLQRAIRSVAAQTAGARLHHLIVCDLPELDLTESVVRLSSARSTSVEAVPLDGTTSNARVARLRNHAVRIASSEWIAFLDDDNVWGQEHIESLRETLHTGGVQAAHSEMLMYTRDGVPYLEERDPWFREEADGRREFQRLELLGVVRRGSNRRRDRLDPWYGEDAVHSVDTSEWLIHRDILLSIPFQQHYSEADEWNVHGEDDKLLIDFIDQGVRVASSGHPSLHYFLGGKSNSFSTP